MAAKQAPEAAAVAELNTLSALLGKNPPSSCTLFLYADRGKGKEQRWKRVVLDAPLSKALAGRAVRFLQTQIGLEPEITPFSYEDRGSDAITFIGSEEVDHLRQWASAVPPDDWKHVFEGDEEYAKHSKFQTTRLKVQAPGGSEELLMFKQRGFGSLARKNGIYAMVVKQSQIHVFHEPKGPIYHFDNGADFFLWKKVLYVLSYGRFETLTGFRDHTSKKAVEGVMSLGTAKNTFIPNLDKIADRIALKPRHSGKFANASATGILEGLNPVEMVRVIDEREMAITYEKKGNAYHFNVNPDDNAQIREFVELCNDDNVKGDITGFKYVARNKRRVT